MTPSREDDLETIGGHVYLVIDKVGEWPDDPPEDADALAAWAYVQGYANGRGMTARELIESLKRE